MGRCHRGWGYLSRAARSTGRHTRWWRRRRWLWSLWNDARAAQRCVRHRQPRQHEQPWPLQRACESPSPPLQLLGLGPQPPQRWPFLAEAHRPLQRPSLSPLPHASHDGDPMSGAALRNVYPQLLLMRKGSHPDDGASAFHRLPTHPLASWEGPWKVGQERGAVQVPVWGPPFGRDPIIGRLIPLCTRMD